MKKTGKWIFLIFIVSFIAFFNTFRNDFVFDDHSIIDQNVIIRSLKNIPCFFTSSYWPISQGGDKKGLYRPVVITSYALDYFIWKLKPFGYHLTNYLFHSFNGVLIFLLFLFILNNAGTANGSGIALFASLIFIVHPVHVEAVTGIVGRAELFSAFFFLSALFLYIRAESGRYYFISLLLFLAALMSKESAVVLPLIIVLYDMLFKGTNEKGVTIGKLKEKIPRYLGYLAVMAVYMFIRFSVLSGIGPKGTSKVFYQKGILARIYTMAVVFYNYVKLLFCPVGLSPEKRDFPVFESFLNVKVIIGLLLVILVLYFAFSLLRKRKVLAFCIFWFLLALLPVSNIIPIGILIADRLLYLPSIGFSVVLALPLAAAGREKYRLMSMFLIAIIVLFSMITIKRNTDWRNDITLWENTIKRFPGNYVAHNNIGALYYLRDRYDDAIIEYNRVLDIKPDYVEAWNNLGFAYKKKGQLEKAVDMYKKAIEIKHEYSPAYNGLGYLYYEIGEYDKAEKWYRKAIETDPELEEAYNNLGLLYQNKKIYRKAEENYVKAVQVNPDYENGHFNLGNLYYETGAYSNSVKEFKEVSRINPERADINMNIGMVYYSKLREYEKALKYFHRYLELSPDAADGDIIRKIIKQIS